VSIGASTADPANFRPFLEQMRELGYIDGQNIIFDRRFAGGEDSLISVFVADLVRRPVDVIVATGTRETLAAKSATSSVPIVTFISPDPIGMGLAESLAHPGANVTGLTTMDLNIYGKRIELLNRTVPNLKRVAVLLSGRQPLYSRDSPWARDFARSAKLLDISLEFFQADEENLEAAFKTMITQGAQGLVITSDGVYVPLGKDIAKLAIKYRLPTIFVYPEQVRAGGLLAYAAKVADLSRRAAFFVDRILKGEKPADLPIEQPKEFEFIVNLRTAKRLSITVPPSVLAIADEVIE
jgi:putative ABC transport system substrate-binding protein